MTSARPSGELSEALAATSLERITGNRSFDAIVVGAGAAGGLAAKLLAEGGMRVLVLDAGWTEPWLRAPLRRLTGRIVPAIADPRLEDLLPAGIVEMGKRALRLAGRVRQPVQSKCFAWPLAPDGFVDDRDQPYTTAEDSPFAWYRSQQIGGRMIIPGHGRQYYRLAPEDLGGGGTSWGLRPGELDPWYALVERLLLINGGAEHCPWVPDSEIAQAQALNAAEADLAARVRARWPRAQPILGRWAPPLAGLDAAARTGRLACRRGALVREILVDAVGHVSGVGWFDRQASRMCRASAPLVFLCASSLESTRILLLSRGAGHPDGLGARSGALGRYLMDHIPVSGSGIGDDLPGTPVRNEPGRCVLLPRFDLRDTPAPQARGFALQVYRWSGSKGRSHFVVSSFGEMPARRENGVTLDPVRRDAWGAPVLRIACRHDDADRELAALQCAAIREVADLLGVELHRLDTGPGVPGSAIDECGTARMGSDPTRSVVDPNNECWEARGLYVTDGAAFAAQGVLNPTLTILALTARACHHAARAAGAASAVPAKSTA